MWDPRGPSGFLWEGVWGAVAVVAVVVVVAGAGVAVTVAVAAAADPLPADPDRPLGSHTALCRDPRDPYIEPGVWNPRGQK